MSQMWRKQHPNCAFLQYLRHITSNCPSSHAPPGRLCSASRPTVLSVPVSRKLLGGRANKQDKQHSHRTPPTLHRRNRGHDIRILLRLDLRNLVGAWCLRRGSVRHRILNRRRNLRARRSPPHILPPEKQWSHATLDSLRNIDIPRRRQRVPPPVWQRRILDIILRHRSTPLHRLPRRHPSRTLWDSLLPGTRKNRSSRNTTTNDTATARKTTLVAKFSQKRAM